MIRGDYNCCNTLVVCWGVYQTDHHFILFHFHVADVHEHLNQLRAHSVDELTLKVRNGKHLSYNGGSMFFLTLNKGI